MRKLSLALALTVAAAAAAPAFAGPIGSGLWHTDQVAKARKSAINIAHADASCLAAVAPSVAGHSAVRAAAVKNGKLAVQFHTESARSAEAGAVHAMVSKACAGAVVVDA